MLSAKEAIALHKTCTALLEKEQENEALRNDLEEAKATLAKLESDTEATTKGRKEFILAAGKAREEL